MKEDYFLKVINEDEREYENNRLNFFT